MGTTRFFSVSSAAVASKKPGPAVLCVLLVLGLFGAGLLLYTSARQGPRVTTDSLAYLDAARSLADGQGFMRQFNRVEPEPLTGAPPLLPALLGAGAFLGIDPMQGARWLNAFFFACSIVLVGIAVQRVTRSSGWALFAALLFATARNMLRVYLTVWTEAAFICLGLAGMMLCARYMERGGRGWLAAAAAALALAFLDRFVGITLVGTAMLALLAMRANTWKRRGADAALMGAIGFAPAFLWMGTNALRYESSTGRSVAFHPPGSAYLWEPVRTASLWVLPGRIAPGLRGALFVGGVLVAAVLFFVVVRQGLRRRALASEQLTRPPALVVLLALFVGVYVAFFTFSATFFDAHLVLNERLIAPVYVACLVLAAWAGRLFVQAAQGRRAWRDLLVAACVLLGLFYVRGAAYYTVQRSQDNNSYSSRRVQQLDVLESLRALPGQIPVYTNEPAIIYLHAGRNALELPTDRRDRAGQPNENYEQELAKVVERVRDEDGVIVYFDDYVKPYDPTEQELRRRFPLRQVARTADGAIYAVERESNGRKSDGG